MPRKATSLTFKHEDQNKKGEPIGPVIAWAGDGLVATEEPVPTDWVTLSEAKRLAEERGLHFYED